MYKHYESIIKNKKFFFSIRKRSLSCLNFIECKDSEKFLKNYILISLQFIDCTC